MPDAFFDETSEQSAVKAAIVAKYLWAWATVIKPTVKKRGGSMAYLDLFAGPGRYKDGADSTPLLVLRKLADDPELSQMLVTIFNDKDEAHCRALQNAVDSLPGIQKLKHKPVIRNDEVGDQVVTHLQSMKLVPTLFFVDPWGYKGLSLQLVNTVVRDWACECIFFFNYNRVNMGLENEAVATHMNALFGVERAELLRDKLEPLSPAERELAIVDELCKALNPNGKRFILPFCFTNDAGTRTTHHLIFVTKHFRGYNIMKGIMAKESSQKNQDVATFSFCPSDSRCPFLFDLTRPIDDLPGMLLAQYQGQTLSFRQLYEEHSVGKPFMETHYRSVLRKMEKDHKIHAKKADGNRKAGTFPDDVLITFA